MVTEWGMSELGPVKFSARESDTVFIGREMTRAAELSEDTMKRIDAEIRRVIDEQYTRAKKLLHDRLDALERVAEGLLEHETLNGEEVSALIDGRAIRQSTNGAGNGTSPSEASEDVGEGSEAPEASAGEGDEDAAPPAEDDDVSPTASGTSEIGGGDPE
jgi:cell division protease FtsH